MSDSYCVGPPCGAFMCAATHDARHYARLLSKSQVPGLTWMYSKATSGSMLEAMTALPKVVGPQRCCSTSHAIILCPTSHLLAACVLTATSLCSSTHGTLFLHVA